MINEKLLNKEIENYKRRNIDLKPSKYNRNKIFNMFKKYKYFGITKDSFCCYGEEHCCWQDVIEDGVWNYNLKYVRIDILYTLKNLRHIIRNKKQGNRYFICENEKGFYIYIYARDTNLKKDFHIWFSNEEY